VRANIPRSAQPQLTVSQQRILMCDYELDAANERFPYSLFVPTSYDPAKPSPLIVNLHGAGVTPLQQMLFDGVTDFAERDGYIVVTPMGHNTTGFWGAPRGTPRIIETADVNPATGVKYAMHELSEMDAMAVLAKVRATFNVDNDRIYLTGHSMGGFGTYYLGARHSEIWAGLAPIAGGGISASATGEKLKGIPMLVMHGADDMVVRVGGSRNSVRAMQELGMQHIYLEFPGKEHEFWIRRGRENIEKVFQFFNLVSKRTNRGPIPDPAAEAN
jgi:predicted peptidase